MGNRREGNATRRFHYEDPYESKFSARRYLLQPSHLDCEVNCAIAFKPNKMAVACAVVRREISAPSGLMAFTICHNSPTRQKPTSTILFKTLTFHLAARIYYNNAHETRIKPSEEAWHCAQSQLDSTGSAAHGRYRTEPCLQNYYNNALEYSRIKPFSPSGEEAHYEKSCPFQGSFRSDV